MYIFKHIHTSLFLHVYIHQYMKLHTLIFTSKILILMH